MLNGVQFKPKGVWVRTAQGRAFFPFSHKAKFHPSRDDRVWACMMDDEDTEDRTDTIPLCIFLPGTT
jgi:hypothetical protein